jgi:hypothetical protein
MHAKHKNTMKTESQNCYEAAEQNLFTRFETEPGSGFLLPYSSLMFARLTPATEGEILTLVYVTHNVTIAGSQLSALLHIVQKGRAETIRAGGSADGNNTPAVRKITITEGADNLNSL